MRENKLYPDNNNQRKMTKTRIEYIPLNIENFDEQIEQFTNFNVEFEKKCKRTDNKPIDALWEEMVNQDDGIGTEANSLWEQN